MIGWDHLDGIIYGGKIIGENIFGEIQSGQQLFLGKTISWEDFQYTMKWGEFWEGYYTSPSFKAIKHAALSLNTWSAH